MVGGYVQPNGDIRLYKNVPLNPNYSDVLYARGHMAVLSELQAYFVKIYTKESYTRVNTGYLKIMETPDSILDCNYLSFTNNFQGGNKTYFCFITSINYISNNCAGIEYVVDDFNTWFSVLELGQCFVEREIPATDELYGNLVPENLECGEKINNGYSECNFGDDPYYLIETTTDSQGSGVVGQVSGFACPLHFMKLSAKVSPQTLYSVLQPWLYGEGDSRNSPDNLVNIQIVPKRLAELAVPEPNSPQEGTQMFVDVHQVVRIETLQGYTPKNKKLLTYPYTSLVVSNHAGSIKEFKWENIGFSGEDYCEFFIAGSCLGQPTIVCYPQNYKGVTDNYDEAIILTNFPPVPWACDTYKAYLAQNKNSIMTSILSSALSMLPNAFGSNVNSLSQGETTVSNTKGAYTMQTDSGYNNQNAGTSFSTNNVISGGTGILSSLAKLEDSKFMPTTIANLANGDMLTTLLGQCKFSFYQVSIKREMAEIIDNFFSAYGYATHKVKIPNISSRPYWNYTQTKGCILKGSAPAYAKQNIINAMNSGVRFWKKLSYIGNFNLPNNI